MGIPWLMLLNRFTTLSIVINFYFHFSWFNSRKVFGRVYFSVLQYFSLWRLFLRAWARMAVLMSERVNEVDKTSVLVCECEHVEECVSFSLSLCVCVCVWVCNEILSYRGNSFLFRPEIIKHQTWNLCETLRIGDVSN